MHKSNFFAVRSDNEDRQCQYREDLEEKQNKAIEKLLKVIKTAEKENFILFLDNIDELTREKVEKNKF